MMKRTISILLLLCCSYSYAQKCNCLNELLYLEDKAEHSLPSYQDQVTGMHRAAAYATHKQECNKIAAQLTDQNDCIYLVAKYISFFRDEHLSVNFKKGYLPFSSLDDTSTVRSFFAKEKIYPMPVASKLPATGIEGWWQSRDNAYIIEVVKHKTPLSDYAGFIVKGDSKFWTRGQLKFLLKQTEKDKYESIYIRPTRQPRQYHAALSRSSLTIGRINTLYRMHDTVGRPYKEAYSPESKLSFTQLSAKTNYLRIPDFSFEVHGAIDSIVKANLATLTAKPNLIIDVRNNGGGGDRSYQALLPVVMDKKLTQSPITANVLASPDIIQYFNDTRYLGCETKEDSIGDDSTLALMGRYIGRYTPVVPDTIQVDTIYQYPAKVIILANRWCASTTEGFIKNALQSKKVMVYGENTGGMCSYGDWRLVGPPCLPVELSMPTKKMNYLDGSDYEAIGIPPHMPLDPAHDEDWIKIVTEAIEK